MVQKIRLLVFSFTLVFSTFCFGKVEKIEINQNKSSAEFLCIGNPSALKIRGEKAKVQGSIGISNNLLNASLKVDLDEFVTGIDMRDEHMKEKYFETGKPENKYATLEILNLYIPISYWKGNEDYNGEFKGKLKLHNVEKEITGKIIFSPYKSGNEILTTSSFSLKLSDFNIVIPSFAGITVAEDVNVEVKLPLTAVEK